jgi:farnesyl-diphosphate farnesyltransferase
MQNAARQRSRESADGGAAGPEFHLVNEPEFHDRLLAGVSRTFAFTIPQLPDGLREAVTNAYLLCRIADTIEDDPKLDAESKDRFLRLLLEALETGYGAEAFARALSPRLAPTTLAAEIELVRQSPRVLRVTRCLASRQRSAIHRCVATMSSGMSDFERGSNRTGLADMAALERYCYFVAGVVGEMLTELFCAHSKKIDARHDNLEARAVSFGIGLQLTNILKDVWEDYAHGVCWLPRDVFSDRGYDLDQLAPHHNGRGPAFAASMRHLVGVAHGYLREALAYTLVIPRSEPGIRRFLIWAALLAVSTLGKISANPLFESGARVKVSRRRVKAIVALSNATIRSDMGLGALFSAAARGLPLVDESGSSTLVGRETTTQ